jgi:hypothetical protein
MSGARLRTPGNARALSAADDAGVFSFIASKCAREPESARLRDALQGSCSAILWDSYPGHKKNKTKY